ncbi:MAG TPA: OmpA family protein [Edaphocola sp.]|nr:OmpA family protein [Edaphocola sp.]
MDLLKLVKNYLPEDLIQNVAGKTGESEQGVSKFIGAALPTILGSLISKSSNDGNGIFDLAKGALGSGLLGNLGSIMGTNEQSVGGGFNIWSIVKSLFGDKLGGIVRSLASFAGVKESSANSLMGLTSLASLGALGTHAKENNLDATGLTSFLGKQQSSLASWIPSGFDFSKIAGTLGLGSLFAGTAHATERVTNAIKDVPNYSNNNSDDNNKKGGWLIPLVLLGALAVVTWFLLRGCNKDQSGDSHATEQVTYDHATETTQGDATNTTTVAPVRESLKVKLPDGVEIEAFKGGIEDQMVQFLGIDEYKNATNEQLKDKWFNFDNLSFKFGTNELTDSSKVQMDNIVKILQAFKDSKIKVGGYTDSVGNPAANLKLSNERANKIKELLTKAGVGAQVPEAEGYGSQFAKAAPSAPDAERATDRKMAIRFLKK